MDYNVSGISEIAIFNKRSLRNKYFNIPVADNKYRFKISGVGNLFIKIEKFFYYSDIIKSVRNGNENGFEFALEQIVVDPRKIKKPVLEDYYELRERALANKVNLKNNYIEVMVGNKKYDFKIAGVGFKSIKIEFYMSYEDIVKELSSGNNYCLEYILMELIMGNEVNYSKFEELSSEKPKSVVEDKKVKVSLDEIDTSSFKKLSEKESEKLILNLKGWNRLVFDAIEDIFDDLFTFEELLNQKRIVSYKSRGDNLDEKVLDNLNQLIDIGLVLKVNETTYFKLW